MHSLLKKLNIQASNPGACWSKETWRGSGDTLVSHDPATGNVIASVCMATRSDYDEVVSGCQRAFRQWRCTPAPVRGQVIRDLGNRLRDALEPLGELVSLEMGKIRAEGIGEVQEMIDICDFAVGLSRQLYGNAMHSERPGHRMVEQWHPLGPVGIISAFNFPVAVWSWNAAVAAVCGDTLVWKPSPRTPLTAIAVQHLGNEIMHDHGIEGLFGLAIGGDSDVAPHMVEDPRLPLISFTGSSEIGRVVGQRVAARFGRSLLELGGNNAIIVTKEADLTLAIPSIVFGAVGTAGQRCTTTRRLLVDRSIMEEVIERLKRAYSQLRIGDPLDPTTHVGPLVSESAVLQFEHAIANAREEGGVLEFGGKRIDGRGHFVQPTILRMNRQSRQVHAETFAPILYVIPFDTFEEAIGLQNEVPQGLSSAIFTCDLCEAERFLSAEGSDCGIANVNVGTSGAEIGGAFGGEKETGGGRESGSDAWKIYMRRQTTTINYSGKMQLAQGIQFG